MLLTNSKNYKGRMLLPEGWEQRFLKVRFALKKKKKKRSDLDKHCKVGEWISHIT